MMRLRDGCWLWLLILLWGSVASAAVKGYTDRSQISSDQTVTFVLEHDGQPSSQPDLTPLRQDFEIVSSSRASSMSFANGEMMARVQLQLKLSPKRTGKLTIPSITWGNERTAPIALTVAGTPEDAAEGTSGSKVFLETSVDSLPSYVQAAVNVTVRVYSSQPLYQGSLEFAGNSDALVTQVGNDTIDTVNRNGRPYRVIERHYVVFPQHSGKLELPGAVLNAQIVVRDRQDPFADDPFNDLFGPAGGMTHAQPIRVNGEAIHFTVAPRPSGVTAPYWLPAQDVSIAAKWQPPTDRPQARVGEPLTLDLRLQADGLMAAQLPDLATLLQLPPGLKAYPDQAKLDNQTHGTRILGSRSQRIALIADQPGEITLPALRVQWWDTATNKARETVVPAQRLTILPGAAGSNANVLVPPATSASGQSSLSSRNGLASGPKPGPGMPGSSMLGASDRGASDRTWLWASLVFAALWLATLAAWAWSRRGALVRAEDDASSAAAARAAASAAQARSAFHDACRRSDPRAARSALLAWVAAAWPTMSPVGLRALARQWQNARIEALLLELDRACYADEPWDGKELGAALSVLPSPEKGRRRGEVLQPLYP